MSIIITDGCDCAEKQLLNNWAAEYSKRAIEDHKTANVLDHPDGSVTVDKIKDGAVTETKIGNSSVSTLKIKDGSITEDKLGEYSVTTGKIAIGAVENKRILSGAVDTRTIADKAVTSIKIDDKAITSEHIADGAINSTNIGANAIESINIADGAVTAEKLADNAVGSSNIANNAVDELAIKDKAVTNPKLGYLSITSDKINTGGIEASRIKANAVKEPKRFTVTEIKAMSNLIDLGVETMFIIFNDTEERISEIRTTANDYILGIFGYDDEAAYLESGCTYLVGMFYQKTEIDAMKQNQITENGLMKSCKVHRIALISDEPPKTGSEYSSTPVKIGTWIDGKPIWRVGFNITEALTPGELFSFNIPVKSSSDVAIINSFAMLRHDADFCDYIDDRKLNQDAGNTWVLPDNLYDATGVYGYIEFATSETNIKGA